MQMTPVPAAKRRHQASSSKKANFLSFSLPLSAELFTPWGRCCTVASFKGRSACRGTHTITDLSLLLLFS